MAASRVYRPFLVVLALAALVRLVVVVAFPPGFVFSDGPTYLALVDDLSPLRDRTVGYGIFLHALSWFSRDVSLIVVVQHLMGLATGGVIYALLRRWSVSPVVATLATLPVLFDGMQLVVEHSVLSDVLFDLMVVSAVAVLTWHRTPRPGTAAVAGLILGLAVCVRIVGEPLVVAGVLFCLAAGVGLRQRLVTSLAVVAAFAAPLLAYGAWYHHDHDRWALSESSGRALYMRTTTFVDCARISVPAYERQLCPEEPVGHRQDPTYYGWHDPDGDHGLMPPRGVTPNEAMHDFAMTAIKAQPWDYLRAVFRDFAYNFTTGRTDRYDYDTAEKWSFQRYVDLPTTSWTRPAYNAHGRQLPSARQPFANLLSGYGATVYLWGPVLLVLLLLSVVGLAWRRPAGSPPTRPLMLVTGLIGTALMLAPDATAEFVWRYQLPAVVLLPMSAALAWTRLAHRETPQPQTTAAPSTDWPNGGLNRRSRNRVVGTTNRS